MNNRYPIKTLADIYNLPTIEQVGTCLREMSAAMLASREADDQIVQSLREGGVDFQGRALDWPESTDWVDDGSGQVGFSIRDEDGNTHVEATFHITTP